MIFDSGNPDLTIVHVEDRGNVSVCVNNSVSKAMCVARSAGNGTGQAAFSLINNLVPSDRNVEKFNCNKFSRTMITLHWLRQSVGCHDKRICIKQ